VDDAVNAVRKAADDGRVEFLCARSGVSREKFTRVGWFTGSDDGDARPAEQLDLASIKKPQGRVGLR
jgi:hypothetical protein